MLFIRYVKNKKIIDLFVTLDTVYPIYKKIKKKYGFADLILLDNDIEHCLM